MQSDVLIVGGGPAGQARKANVVNMMAARQGV